MVIRCGIIEPLLRLEETLPKLKSKQTIVWGLTNLCRGVPPPPKDVLVLIPFFAHKITTMAVRITLFY